MENANKPAMPVKTVSTYGTTTSKGLTKREMFAMHAMQGLLSNSGGVVQANSMSGTTNTKLPYMRFLITVNKPVNMRSAISPEIKPPASCCN